MIEVKAKGINAFMAKLKKHELVVLGHIAETKRKLVKEVFTDLVKGSPQWSGNLASNWYIEFHGNTATYAPIQGHDPIKWYREKPLFAGHPAAVSSTLARELPKIAGVRWNSKVRLVNYTPYASDVEAGIGPDGRPIRPENYKYGQIAMAAYVVTKYSRLSNLKRKI